MDVVSGRRAVMVAVVGAVVVLAAGCGVGPPSGESAAPTSTDPTPTGTDPAPTPVPTPITVPLTLEGGAPRLVAHVEIGGADLRVVVDTGSSGLRVPASRLPPGAVTERGPARPYAYASGIHLQGSVARAPVRIGAAQSLAMPLEVVHGVTCGADQPDCGAADGRTPDLMGGHFDGILGISPQSDPDVGNPLWSLGAVGHAYTVHVDPGGASGLVLGAPPDGFALQQLPPSPRARREQASEASGGAAPPAWSSRVPICVHGTFVPAGSVCLPTLFDTGTPPLANIHPPNAAPSSAAPGSPVTLTTPDGRWSSTDTARPGRGATISPATIGGTDGTITAGLPAFDHTDIRFDLTAGTVGLREHGPT